MFTAVNEGKERAGCQEDRPTFEGMRFAQFSAWPQECAVSYLDDLETAVQTGRNLVEEKYIHMMKYSQPVEYKALLHRVIMPTVAAKELAERLCGILVEQARILSHRFPYVAGQGRPLYAKQDYRGTSIETYQLGELLTYSEGTLSKLLEYVEAYKKDGGSLARDITVNTVLFYGYESLEQAEAAMKERIEG